MLVLIITPFSSWNGAPSSDTASGSAVETIATTPASPRWRRNVRIEVPDEPHVTVRAS